MMFAFSPKNSESCQQYKFGSHRNSGTGLSLQFLPGSSCFHPDPQSSRLLTTALTLQAEFLVQFWFYFFISRFKYGQALEESSLKQGLGLKPGQGHITLFPKVGIETRSLTVQDVYPGQATYENISSVHWAAIVSLHVGHPPW